VTTAASRDATLKHPYLFLSGAEWDALPEKLEDPFFARLHEANIRALRSPHPPHRGRRTWRLHSRGLKSRLVRNIAAWHLTRREPYLQAALDALDDACLRARWETEPGRHGGIRAADLGTGEMLYNVAFAYDALYRQLDDGRRAMCVRALAERGLAAYLRGIELGDWWRECDFNWNSALHGNAGLAALAIRDEDRRLSDRVLECALRGLPHMIAAFYPGGGWIEGAMYVCTAVGHLTDFVVPYYRLTGQHLGLLGNRDFHDTISWLPYLVAGDGGVYNFGDASERMPGSYLPHIYWWADRLERPDWTAFQDEGFSRSGRRAGLFHDVEAFWYRRAFQPAEPPRLERLRHFAGIDWLMWRGERTWLAFRSGYNGGNHDNDDLGHFILGAGDERFLCDPGYGAKRASQHNCITIRWQEQADGATARIWRVQEFEHGFYLACDIREAFPHILRRYDRHLLLTGDEHLLVVDDVQARDRIRAGIREHLQTRLPLEREGAGWALRGSERTLRLVHLSDAADWAVEHWEHDGPVTTLAWRAAWDRPELVQAFLLTFGRPDAVWEADAAGFTLTLGGRAYRFVRRGGGLEFQADGHA